MALDESYIEAVLEWGPDGPTSGVKEWLESHDLQVLPMRVGLLISGTQESFESAFDIKLENAKPPVHLPVPDALRGTVGAITIPPPRQYTG